MLEFLDADYTFVNERLARHYGIAGVTGDGFRRVSLAGTPRGGVLTQASVLAATSNPTRTSPVKRGKWILENILGAPPSPPPSGVEALKEGKEHGTLGTLRQRMEQHRTDPACASCHRRMDPLGFGLENFDAIGGWRSRDDGQPIDSSGQLPGGRAFHGPAELKAALLSRRDAFARCLTEKMLTYALGRGLDRADRRAVDQIVARLARNEYRFSALILAMVESEPFLNPRGPNEGEPMINPQRLSRRTVLRGSGRVGGPAIPGSDAAWIAVCRPAGSEAEGSSAAHGFPLRPQRRPHAGLDATIARQPASSCRRSSSRLHAVKDDLLVLSGLTLNPARALGDGGGDHARAMASFLTGRHPRKTDGADLRAGISVDQVAAQRIGQATRFPSLEIGCEGGKNAGECDHGYSCAYQSNLSWRSETTPVAKEINPRLVFDRLFGSPLLAMTVRTRLGPIDSNKSILDFVGEDARQLEPTLGAADRRKLDEYLTGVRELEQRITRGRPAVDLGVAKYPRPLGIPADYQEHLRLMGDLLVLAFQCDLTRIATFVFANDGSNRSYRTVGVSDGHHDLSHHGGDPAKQEKIQKNQPVPRRPVGVHPRKAEDRFPREMARCSTTA